MATLRKIGGKEFIIGRVLDQSKQDGISLTEIEEQMLRFAEERASKKDMEAAAIFEREYDGEEYERKVAGLLRRAYDSDKAAGKQDEWETALMDLGGEDMYLKVLLNRAHIHDSFAAKGKWWVLLGAAPHVLIVGLAVLLAFTPVGTRLLPNETARLAIYVLAMIFLLVSVGRTRKID
ncbi:MAG: hypothetical protein WBF42_11450 [Terracidiphilus sp.]